MRDPVRLSLLLLLALLLAHGAPPARADGPALATQRTQYRSALAALGRGDAAPFARSRAALADYPLLAYLELAELRGRLDTLPFADVDRFLERHGRGLPAARLREAWLDVLQARERWPDFLRYYVENPANTERRCNHAWALARTGAVAAADAETAVLWAAPRSLPKACDRLFDDWSERGNPGPALAWERFRLAMDAGETALARYLLRFVDARSRPDAELFLRVGAEPALVKDAARFTPGEPHHAQIVAHGLARLAARDPRAARLAFEQHAREPQADLATLAAAAPRIANALAAESGTAAMRWIIGLDPQLRPDALAEDAVRYALRGAGWDEVLAALALLPPPLAASEPWQYWDARSREATATAPAPAWESLAVTRSYYGFLAAERSERPFAMQHEPSPVDDALLRAVENDPGVRRAREFALIGEPVASHREWLHTVGIMSREERIAAARLASRWGWHPLAISTLAAAEEWNALEIRFPTVYPRDFERAARAQRVDQTWLYAIARQESALNPTVKSPAGALGLMQVMPATAQLTARKSGIPYRASSDLLDPSTNVVIGSRYMRMMLDEFQQNRVLAAAAYNAGPMRVKQWLRRLPEAVEHDRFVETIPFRETRKYVQNVLSYAVIYAYLQGRTVPLVQPAERVIRNPFPRQAAHGG